MDLQCQFLLFYETITFVVTAVVFMFVSTSQTQNYEISCSTFVFIDFFYRQMKSCKDRKSYVCLQVQIIVETRKRMLYLDAAERYSTHTNMKESITIHHELDVILLPVDRMQAE